MGKSNYSIFTVLGSRSFTLLSIAQTISSLGSALTTLAASILVFRITDSTLSIGLMLTASAGPTILVGLLAGVFVDRYDCKRIMLVSDILRAILISLIPFLVNLNILWLYIAVALSSSIAQFYYSAHARVLPETTTNENLAAATAVMQIVNVGTTIFGFAAAGFIVSNISVSWAFYIGAFSFALSASLIFFTHLPSLPVLETTSVRAIVDNLKAGLQKVEKTPILRLLFLITIPIFLVFGFQTTLFIPFVIKVLGGTEFHFGLQQAAESLGFALGSFLMLRFANRIHGGQWLAISCILMALLAIAYGLSGTIFLAIFIQGMNGFVSVPSHIGRQLVIQSSTSREMLGRVNSVFFVVRDTMFILGMVLAGLADLFDMRTVFLVSAVILLFVGLVVLVSPGLGQPTAQWKRTLSLLIGAKAAPRLGAGRIATRLEMERFIVQLPEMAGMSRNELDQLAADTLVADAPQGTAIVYRGETSNAAYFILKGKAAAGYPALDEFLLLNYLYEGDFFGEVAALTGGLRTADVITEEDSQFLIIPAKVMKRLAQKYEGLGRVFYATLAERLSRVELARTVLRDQELLREMRTASTVKEYEKSLARSPAGD